MYYDLPAEIVFGIRSLQLQNRQINDNSFVILFMHVYCTVSHMLTIFIHCVQKKTPTHIFFYISMFDV